MSQSFKPYLRQILNFHLDTKSPTYQGYPLLLQLPIREFLFSTIVLGMSNRKRNMSRRGTPGEVLQPHPSPPMKLLQEYLFILSMLSQFKLSQLGVFFSNGLIILLDRLKNVTFEVLGNFTALLLPFWYSHNGVPMNSKLVTAQFEINKLLSSSRKYWVLDSTFVAPLRTCGQWYTVPFDLGYSSYWRES